MWHYSYVDVLQQLVDWYNATHHHSIGMPPNEVNAINEGLVCLRLYLLMQSPSKKFCWRYSVKRTSFAKGHMQEWTRKFFKIVVHHPTVPVTYMLSDLQDEPISPKFRK